MIGAGLAFRDVDQEHWVHLTELAFGLLPERDWLLVFVDGERVVRALRSRVGAVDPATVPWRGRGTPS